MKELKIGFIALVTLMSLALIIGGAVQRVINSPIVHAQTQPPSLIYGTFPITGPINQASPPSLPLPAITYGQGTLVLTFTNVSGSPTGCFFTVFSSGDSTSVALGPNLGLTLQFNPVNGTTIIRPQNGPSAALAFGLPAIGVQMQCITYATNGKVQIEYVPDAQPYFSYSHITIATNTVLKQVPGQLGNVVINQTIGGLITIFDNSTCTGNVIASIASGVAAGTFFQYNILTSTGLCVTTAGTGDITVTYR